MLFQKNKFFILLLLFFSVQLFLVQRNQYQLAIFVYFIFVIILRYFDKKLVVSFFVFYLPLLPIVTTDYKLLGVIGPHEIIYGFSFYYLWDLDRKKLKPTELNDYQKLSIAFIYFLGLSELYILIKDAVVGLETYPNVFIYFAKVIVRLFLYYGSIILLVRNIYLKDFKQVVLQGIKYSILALTTSMIFTKELINMGAGIAIKKDRLERILSGEYQRYLGWYNAGGEENSLGVFMVAAFGFFLAIYEKDRNFKAVIVFMGSAILGSLLTGSRTSFLSLVAVFSIFIFTNKSVKSKFLLFLATIAFYFLFYDRLQLVLERFYDSSAGEALDPDEEGRVGK